MRDPAVRPSFFSLVEAIPRKYRKAPHCRLPPSVYRSFPTSHKKPGLGALCELSDALLSSVVGPRLAFIAPWGPPSAQSRPPLCGAEPAQDPFDEAAGTGFLQWPCTRSDQRLLLQEWRRRIASQVLPSVSKPHEQHYLAQKGYLTVTGKCDKTLSGSDTVFFGMS